MYTLNVKISGLTCGACAKLVKRMVGKIDGVKEANVQSTGETEIVAERIVSKNEIKEALLGSEYKVL